MKTLGIVGMVPLVLIAATAFSQGDNRAVPRGGGDGGGGGGSSAGSRHSGGSSSGSSSGSSAGSSSHSGGDGGSSAQGSGSRYNDSTSGAAQRRPRPGTGTGTRDRYGNDYSHYYSYPYSNYYYNPYYSYSWGYPGRYGLSGYGYGYYDYGYSYGDYYGYYPQSYNRPYGYRTGNSGHAANVAQLRILVEPVKARVYVDGYYAGIVDDFDGLTQRLNVSPGRHDITFKLEGYTSHTFSTSASPDQTLKLRFDMVKGGGETRDSIGEAYDRRPEPDQDRDSDTARYSSPSAPDRTLEVDSARAERPYVPPSREIERGELLLEIEPADASVYVDGEFFGKASQVTRLELAGGRHRIEVVRPGYRTRETEVDIDREAKRVTVKLEK